MNLNENKLNYVVSTFCSFYNIKNEFDIHYGIDGTSKIQVSSSGKDLILPETGKVIFKEWYNKNIPFIFDTEEKEIIKQNKKQIIIQYDIIASSFYFLSGYQEYINNKEDLLNRFPFKKSIQYKLHCAEIPLVNYYFDILKSAIEKAYKIKIRSGSKFTTCVSHDIDKCNTGWLEDGFYCLKKGKVILFLNLAFKKLFLQKDNWFNFNHILEYEKKNDIRSTFFFLTNKRKYGKYRNADYNIHSKKIKKVFSFILNNHSEIGLHAGFGTFNNAEKFNKEVEDLNLTLSNQKIKGTRFHFLSFNIKITPGILSLSKLVYDETLAFAENIGFRNGICSPFYLYDFKNDRPIKEIVEIPLIVMDSSLLSENYMNLTHAGAVNKVKQIIVEILKFNGCFTILWHNSLFADYKYKGWKSVFEEIIEFCKLHQSIFISSYELAKIWEKNSK